MTLGKELNLGTIALETESIGLGDVTVTASVAVSRKTPVAVAVIDPVAIENKLSTQEFPEILNLHLVYMLRNKAEDSVIPG